MFVGAVVWWWCCVQGCDAKLREEDGKPYVTDNDNYIVDLYFTDPIKDANQAGKEVRTVCIHGMTGHDVDMPRHGTARIMCGSVENWGGVGEVAASPVRSGPTVKEFCTRFVSWDSCCGVRACVCVCLRTCSSSLHQVGL